MKSLSRSHTFATKASFRRGFLCAVALFFLVAAASAAPVTYTGFTITDGQLGTWAFHNARVYLTFRSDTNNVQFIQPPDPVAGHGATIDAWVNQTGKASVTIISGAKAVHANFAPNQIFVSVDLGNTGRPHVGARGLGFSSFTSYGIEPAYPLGLEDGTLDWGDIFPPGVASPELATLSTDLKHSTAFSGRAWPCVGFSNACAPPNALHTDKGDLYLYVPYSLGTPADEGNNNDSLSAGFFAADVGEAEEEDGLSVPVTTTRNTSPTSITYYGYVISDVTLGRHHYSAAQVYLSFAADTSTVLPFNQGSSHGFFNAFGNAHVTIISGAHVASTDFAPDQLVVYYDVGNASVGFGSFTGGLGYPLTLTAHSDYNFLVENSSVGAVSDLTNVPADAGLYSPKTASLATDLTNPTTLSGAASSCVAFDPVTSACSNLTPIALQTNRGDFYLFEPYTDDETANSVPGPYSINWGVFWSEPGHPGRSE
jgi:hypothetical protein